MESTPFSYYKVAMHYLNNINNKQGESGEVSHFRGLVNLMGEKDFNGSYEYALLYSEVIMKDSPALTAPLLENIFVGWHKMFRQVDACNRFPLIEVADNKDFDLNGIVDRLFYTFVRSSNIPFKTMKFVLRQEKIYHDDPTEVDYMLE